MENAGELCVRLSFSGIETSNLSRHEANSAVRAARARLSEPGGWRRGVVVSGVRQ